ncbi:alpha/beta fold hydrolase [Neptunicella marina]|uniref:Alpha/beta hydrolase n=1 Tax=Neptunicella marina TaxID=2125989 RepID=A0A8J6M3R7_9ALTE|nr:alpha/beta hydrolase [Neptunicella marina]MBC3767768.1 alpha/beta hydrolase [Neptunicella marina]
MQGVSVSGQGPAVVLLHSSMSSSRQWRLLVESLQAKYQVINIDMLGYGSAPQAAGSPFRLDAEVERIEHILGSLGIEKASWIGHSYGGATALKIAVQKPQWVERLVIFEPVAFHLLPVSHPQRQKVDALGAQMHQMTHEQAAKQFINYWNGEGFFEKLPQPIQQQFAAQVIKTSLDFEGLTGETYGQQQLKHINCPTLLLKGKLTQPSAAEVAKIVSANIAGCQVVTTAGGHMAPVSHATEVNKEILAFMAC